MTLVHAEKDVSVLRCESWPRGNILIAVLLKEGGTSQSLDSTDEAGSTHPTRPVELAEVLDAEAVDDDRATAVVLNHLVVRALSTAASDSRRAAVLLDGDGLAISSLATKSLFNPATQLTSSQTASNHTFVRVHEPKQCTPSAWSAPITTFDRLAPSSRRNTASLSPPSACPVHEVPRSKRTLPPSKSPVTVIGSESELVEGGEGKVQEAARARGFAATVSAVRARKRVEARIIV